MPVEKLIIVIVNYRTAGLVVDCLASLEPEVAGLPMPCKVVVVDNASGDGSAEKVAGAIRERGWSEWAEVLPSERNLGFAGGNNLGIRHAMGSGGYPEYVLLLNPDTVVRPGGVKELLEFAATRPKVGIVGGRLEDAQGKVESAARRLPSPLGELDSAARVGVITRLVRGHVVAMPVESEPHRCDWISGACMLIRRGVIESIGLMDDGYFLYYEEVDFCTRAGRAGWECWYVPSSCILHLEGSSTGIQQARKRRAPYWYEARRRYFVKTYGKVGLVTADLLWTFGRAIGLARRAVGSRRPNNDPLYFSRDLLGGDLRWLLAGKAIADGMSTKA